MTIQQADPAPGRSPDADLAEFAGADRLTPEQGASVGRTDLGLISVNDQVVQKLASRAAVEIPDAGAAAPRLLGRPAGFGFRRSSLTAPPKASAKVDGSTVVLSLSISVRWPASVPAVTTAVRDHVTARLVELTGLTISQFNIAVTDLVSYVPPPPRAR
jgi:uncharacterized alkaline shock family protein YloU